MYKKTSTIFLLSLLIFYFLLQAFTRTLVQRQEAIDAKQTSIIQENVKDRFKLFLNLPLSIGIIGADYFSKDNFLSRHYSPAAETLLRINREILGLNILNKNGLIVRVHPQESNPDAAGRITQNLEALKTSYQKGELFWFSPPFDLYQGKKGFVIYVPIVRDQDLKGWFAPVINAEIFFNRFKLDEFLKSYDLIIKDKETHHHYFSTSDKSLPESKIYETTANIMGREIVFQNWRKNNGDFFQFPWYWNFSLALIFAIISALLVKLYEQRKKAREQLNEISGLLRLTSKEALSNLVDIHSEFNQLEPSDVQRSSFSKNVFYLTNLIEQIDLLQTMAQAKEEIHHEVHSFLPLLERQLEILHEVIEKKDLHINFKNDNLAKVSISANGWLLQNSVLSNVLSHALIYAQSGSTLEIENKSSDESHFITFHVKQILQKGRDGATKMNRRMEVAKGILHIYHGELFVQNDLAEGMIIRILLPKYD